MYDELTSKYVTVRKRHTCEWCGESIETGDRAHYRTYKFDGDFVSAYKHLECWAAMDQFDWCVWGEEEFQHGAFERGSCIDREDGVDWSRESSQRFQERSV